MLIEAFLTIGGMIASYGVLEAFLITSFLTAVVSFAFVLLALRFVKKNSWLTRLVVTVVLFAGAWFFELFHYGVQGNLFLFVIPCLLVYFFIVTPVAFLYNAVMKKWPVLPPIIMQFCACFVGSVVFWAVIMFWFDVFQLALIAP